MRITPINVGETIIEPFWDSELSGLREWQIDAGTAYGLIVRQNWCWAEFEWARKPASGPTLRMSRACDLDCRRYDALMVSIMAPEGALLRIRITTDREEIVFQAPPAPVFKKEHAVALNGARALRRIVLEVEAAADGPAAGWFNWIGLRNTQLLDRHLELDQRFHAGWEGYLQPEGFEPAFTPTYGLLIDADELAALRTQHAAYLARHPVSPFLHAAELARKLEPEQMIGDYVNFWGDSRYNRERDHGKHILVHGPNAAIAGLLLRDKQLLRLGARYAMALAMCRHWDDGMICCFPDGNFDHRCFVQSLCVFEIALILDLAGEYFTPLGRDLLLRRIAEEGLGNIHYNTWRYEYIFHCNQLAWFTPGRMLGCLLLERHWPRVRPYTEIACRELIESLDDVILPDGGYVEGPTYFCCVGHHGGLPLYLYARARGLPFEEVIPASMRRCGDFGAVFRSSDPAQDQIPMCDAGPKHPLNSLAFMASALPQSEWVSLFRKAYDSQRPAADPPPYLNGAQPMADLMMAWVLESKIPPAGPGPAPFVFLPTMGVMASTRTLGKETVKLLVTGNTSGAGHTHEDKGSFVLEFAGETFALDPGTCDYSSPFAGLYCQCERHNMLVPFGLAERPHPECPLMADVKPVGTGDAVRFHATIDATPGWAPYYRRWQRTWDSPAPDRLTVCDEYELVKGDGVEFYWNTRLPVRIEGQCVQIEGQRGRIRLEAPSDCMVRVETLPVFSGHGPLRRIAIRRQGAQGSLRVTATLSTRE